MPLTSRKPESLLGDGWLASRVAQPLSKRYLRWLVIALGSYALGGGLVTLLGWVTGWNRLMDWEGNGITMKANAAIASALSGACLVHLGAGRGSSRLNRAGALVVALLGALTLVEHLSGWNLHIDMLLFEEAPGARATASPGRMGIPASTSFMLVGMAIFLVGARRQAHKWSVRFGVVSAAIATLSLIGHFYGADAMFSIPRLTGIASQTASMILALALGVIACVPEHDPVRLAMERGSAGVLMRCGLPVVIVVPFALGWLRVWIQQQGWVDTAFGSALRTVTEVGLLTALLWCAAKSVRKQERALFENRDLLHTTVQSIGDGVITTDQQGRVTYLNTVAETLTGCSKTQAAGRPLPEVFNLIHETTRQGVPNPANRALELGKPVTLGDQTMLISRSGSETPVDDTAAPIRDEEGNTIGCVLIFRDATNRRIAERDLRARTEELERRVQVRTAELQRSNEQLEAFVYSIAHDLRAPLRTMASFAQLLVEDHARALDETGKDFLRRIQDGSGFMDRLLLDLLAYGRTSQATMELEKVDVQKAVDAARLQLSSQIVETGASIEVKGTLPNVQAHESTLSQCLVNLLNNSMKFVAPNTIPRITLFAEILPTVPSEGKSPTHGRVRIWCCDNGIGIAPEHQERVFKVFERLEGGRYPGTGIGLSIVRKGVERMGGRVGIESSLGQGCRFWIELTQAGQGAIPSIPTKDV